MISDVVRHYLKHCGLSERKIARCDANTRLYHDLDIYGDIAEAYMEALGKDYQVDLAAFEFDKHFSPEFPGSNAVARLLFVFVPFIARAARRKHMDEYLPVTMAMLDRAIVSKRWHPSA